MIKYKVDAIILKSGNEPCSVPVSAEFVYDPTDPLAVEIIFDWVDSEGPNTVVWTISRDLLLRGASSLTPVGKGDVRFRFEGGDSNRLLACFRTPYGHADIGLDHGQVVGFLNTTMRSVPFGSECLTESIDEALKEILGS